MKMFNIIILVLLSINCSSNLSNISEVEIPNWVLKTPTSNSKLYAVGIVGPSFYSEDGYKNASDSARKELAKSLGGRVQSVLLYINKKSGSSAEEQYIVEATSWATDLVLSGSTIISTWLDVSGSVPNGAKGFTYALCEIPYNNIIHELFEKINKISNTHKNEDISKLIKNSNKIKK